MNTAGEGNPLLDVEWESCLLDRGRDPELEAYVRKRIGVVPAAVPYMLACPWVVRAQIDLSFERGLLVHLDDDYAGTVAMAASLDNACRYCYATGRFLMRLQGMPEAQVRQFERQLADGSGSRQQTAVINFTYRMSRSDPLVTEADRQPLRDAGFSDAEIRELAYVVCYMVFANRICTIPAIPPQAVETMANRWYVRLLRPVIRYTLERHHSRGKADKDGPGYQGPYAYLVDAYAGSPISRVLAQVLNEVWTESSLSMRCKLLMLAVVARALGCELAAGQAQALLLAQGLEAAELEQILSHLRSPALDDAESLLVPFARQTVWYQPVQIQRAARELAGRLSTEQFVEAVGIVSLANGLCRLGAAVVD